MSTANEHIRPDPPGQLPDLLREQGESEEAIASLLPALEALRQWEAPAPTQADTQRLIEMLAPLLPTPEGRPSARVLSPVRAAREHLMRRKGAWPGRMLDVAFAQVGLLRLPFWIASAFLTLLGMLVLFSNDSIHEATVLRALGPLLAVLGVSAVFRSARLRTLEIELSCPISPVQLALVRLALVLGYDIGLGLVLSLTLLAVRAPETRADVVTLMLHWLAPLLSVSGLALLFSVRLSAEVAAGLAYALWLAVLAISLTEEAPGRLRPLLDSGEAVLALAGMGLLALGIARSRATVPLLLPRR
ncbi:MAG TPA: hypothetical protein VF914_17690 [Chloroflexia bacterium]|jgi:hypothetical protein